MSNRATKEPFFTVEELADHWRVCTRTIRRLIEKGELAVVRIGRRVRIPSSSVDAFEAARTMNKPRMGG